MNRIILLTAFIFAAVSYCNAQEQQVPYSYDLLSPAPSPAVERTVVKLQDFQTVIMTSLRETFPRNPGIFSTAHSCRLPEYGPVVSITLQLPPVFFTRQVMQELDRSRKMAEERANRIRMQIDRAAELFKLKTREAELTERMQVEYASGKKGKAAQAALQTELEEVRKMLKELEEGLTVNTGSGSLSDQSFEVDLEKMLSSNYQQLLQRITTSVKNVLADKAPSLADVRENERITITAHVRESFVSAQERSIIFTLRHSDIENYKNGRIDLATLKEKIEIRNESREPAQ